LPVDSGEPCFKAVALALPWCAHRRCNLNHASDPVDLVLATDVEGGIDQFDIGRSPVLLEWTARVCAAARRQIM